MSDATMQEVGDRVRRIETRLTAYMQDRGFDTKTEKPRWEGGAVHIPSRACTLGDCVSVIPHDWSIEKPVRVMIRGEHVCDIHNW